MSTSGRRAAICPQQGFTLVEVMVALSILSVLSFLSFMGITSMIDAEAKLRESSTRLRAVERVFAEFENAVIFASNRRARNAGNELEPALSGQSRGNGYRLSFSQFSTLPQIPPYRMSYLFSPPNVDLVIYPQLDLANEAGVRPVTVLEGLQSVGMRFLGADDRWTDSWPPAGAAANALPRAVELTMDIEGLGSVSRLVARP